MNRIIIKFDRYVDWLDLLVDFHDFFVHAIKIPEQQQGEKEKHRLNQI